MNDIPKKINIYIEGSPGAITKCRSLSTSNDIWSYGTGANSSDIYYSKGHVGVGTMTPGAQLEINGGLALKTV